MSLKADGLCAVLLASMAEALFSARQIGPGAVFETYLTGVFADSLWSC